ncbi:hypothetical protein ACP70R_009503 [Stipagrostis hirtigluma subsp. patula]
MVERERDDEGEAKATSGPLLGGEEEEAASETRDQQGGDEVDVLNDEKEEEENDEEWSEIRLAIEQLSPARLKRAAGKPAPPSPPATLPFLGLSQLLLQVLDKIGPTMAVLRLDVQRNIERVQELYLLDPSKYSTLTEIVEKEVKEGTARKVDSCARAVLWLARLGEDTDQQQSFAQLVEAAYAVTLKPWHGWISSAAYKIALKLVPERKIFTGLLVGTGQDCSALKNEIKKLAVLLQPLLDDIHSMMAKFRLDRLKST